MECKKIQDWLITDYLDNELDPQCSAEVEQHLKKCSACREFLDTVRDVAVKPLKTTGILQPGAAVWQRIREKIETERERSRGWFGRLADIFIPLLQPSLPAFRVAFVTVAVVAIVLVANWPVHSVDPAYAYIEEQAAFLGELQSGNPDLLNGDLTDYDAVFESLTD